MWVEKLKVEITSDACAAILFLDEKKHASLQEAQILEEEVFQCIPQHSSSISLLGFSRFGIFGGTCISHAAMFTNVICGFRPKLRFEQARKSFLYNFSRFVFLLAILFLWH